MKSGTEEQSKKKFTAEIINCSGEASCDVVIYLLFDACHRRWPLWDLLGTRFRLHLRVLLHRTGRLCVVV